MDDFNRIVLEELENINSKHKLVSSAKRSYLNHLRSCNRVLQELAKEIKKAEKEEYGDQILVMNIDNGVLHIKWKYKKIIRCNMNLLTSQWVCETTGGRKFISDGGNNFDLDDNMDKIAKTIVKAFVKHYKSLGNKNEKK